ncbi:hypothetical protein TRIUR3_22740 [Triticum urartu]|uniref:Uncharacterized protein n=1 Tax=Triticum urartu TaxID=4572 RepID=M7ZND1_TRIUA|nr:hypothetical protein TRIUR3_22740 [Triticum urartu]
MAAPALLSAPPPLPPMEEDGLTSHVAPSPTTPPPPSKRGFLRGRPPIRVTSEFDSERQLFSHRISCRVLNGLAKLRFRVHHGAAGGAPTPEVALMGRNFSAVVDTASRGAVLRGTADLAGSLHLSAAHNTKGISNADPDTASVRRQETSKPSGIHPPQFFLKSAYIRTLKVAAYLVSV